MNCYAGIGSRDTPNDILRLMKQLGTYLEKRGWILRSGHAEGADLAFESGVRKEEHKEIYLPWQGFNGSDSIHFTIEPRAFKSVNQFHPNPKKLTPQARLLMARNYYQVMGYPSFSNDTSKMIICWTPYGKEVGGTAQALRIAKHYDVTIFNLALKEVYARFYYLLRGGYERG